MVLYILRHEQRNKDKIEYFTPLNFIGKFKSGVSLYNKFININIDMIISSPYKRTLDTVYKISIGKKIKISIDWGIAEWINNTKTDNTKTDKLIWPSKELQYNLHTNYNVDNDYIPTSTIDYIDSYNEKSEQFTKRVDNFINYIETLKNKNILVVSHQSVTDRIINKLCGKNINLNMGEYYVIDLN
tara:strand:+ start:147 stop:704 length:558 start_codon:yes stop_codon:yes gene_type:complete